MDKETLMKKYKSGDISKEDVALFEKYIHDGIIELHEIEDLHSLHESIKMEEEPEASQQLRSGVYQMIAKEKRRVSQPDYKAIFQSWFENVFTSVNYKVAYTFAMLLIGTAVGWVVSPTAKYQDELANLNGEVREMKEIMMINMLENSSASERLKAVSIGYELGADAKVIEALLKTLNNDDNVNVRLASLEALEPYASNAEVRSGLILSIRNQTSPMVQLTLAELMVKLQDKNAVKEFKDLFDQQNIHPDVKRNIESNINQII
jgi:hypothetical protein